MRRWHGGMALPDAPARCEQVEGITTSARDQAWEWITSRTGRKRSTTAIQSPGEV
jgi:hypothetical protein